jgi:hypothetical protein
MWNVIYSVSHSCLLCSTLPLEMLHSDTCVQFQCIPRFTYSGVVSTELHAPRVLWYTMLYSPVSSVFFFIPQLYMYCVVLCSAVQEVLSCTQHHTNKNSRAQLCSVVHVGGVQYVLLSSILRVPYCRAHVLCGNFSPLSLMYYTIYSSY